MYFFEQMVYQEPETVGANLPQPQQTAVEEPTYSEEEPPTEIISVPIKRYFLIKKLFALNEKLNRLRMRNDILNFVISFVDNFSYEALLIITRKIVDEIHTQVKYGNPTNSNVA